MSYRLDAEREEEESAYYVRADNLVLSSTQGVSCLSICTVVMTTV